LYCVQRWYSTSQRKTEELNKVSLDLGAQQFWHIFPTYFPPGTIFQLFLYGMIFGGELDFWLIFTLNFNIEVT